MVGGSNFNVRLLVELQKINARLDEHDNTFGELLMKNQNNPSPRSTPWRKEEEIKLHELPEFDGRMDPYDYLDWERKIERIFEHKHADDG